MLFEKTIKEGTELSDALREGKKNKDIREIVNKIKGKETEEEKVQRQNRAEEKTALINKKIFKQRKEEKEARLQKLLNDRPKDAEKYIKSPFRKLEKEGKESDVFGSELLPENILQEKEKLIEQLIEDKEIPESWFHFLNGMIKSEKFDKYLHQIRGIINSVWFKTMSPARKEILVNQLSRQSLSFTIYLLSKFSRGGIEEVNKFLQIK